MSRESHKPGATPGSLAEPHAGQARRIDWMRLAAPALVANGFSTTLRFHKNQTICKRYVPGASTSNGHPLLQKDASIELHSGFIDVWVEHSPSTQALGAPHPYHDHGHGHDLRHIATLSPGHIAPELAAAYRVAQRAHAGASLRLAAHSECCLTVTTAASSRHTSRAPAISAVLDTLAERLPTATERSLISADRFDRSDEEVGAAQAFHDALDAGEIAIEFLPVCTAATNQIAGYAARPTWHQRQYCVLGTVRRHADVISNAVLSQLTEQLLERAGRWLQATVGKSGFVCIPLTAAQLMVPNADQLILNTLQRRGVSPRQVWVDLDESEFPSEGTAEMRRLDRLRGKGLRFVLSDFGREVAPINALCSGRADAVKLNTGWLDEREPMASALSSVIAICNDQRVITVGDCAGSGHRAALAAEAGCLYFQRWNDDRMVDRGNTQANTAASTPRDTVRHG